MTPGSYTSNTPEIWVAYAHDLADDDEFICDECGDTWDIEDSTRRDDGLLICPECVRDEDRENE